MPRRSGRVGNALFRLWRVYVHAGGREGEGSVYERIGVRRLSRVLMGGRYANLLVGRLRGREHRTIRGKRSACEWLVFTMVAELGHGVVFLVMLAMSVRYAWGGRWGGVAIMTILNLVVNVVPIVVQRYNRARILRALHLDAASLLDARFWAHAFHLDDPPPDPP